MRPGPRSTLPAAAGLALALGAAGALLSARWRATDALEQARGAARRGDELALVPLGARARAEGPAGPVGARVITSAGEARAGAALDGIEYVATSGGLLARRGGTITKLTSLDGLPTADLTAAERFGGQLVVGGADGTLAVVAPDGLRALRPEGPSGAVLALAADGTRLVALVAGRTVLDLDLPRGRARDLARRPGGAALRDPTALALLSGGRAAVGTADGTVLIEDEGGLRSLGRGDGLPVARITALAELRGDLFVGTPFALYRLPGGRGPARPARDDVLVTALAARGAELYVGTFDDGLLVLDPSTGTTRGALGGRRVLGLRADADGVRAYGQGGAWLAASGADFEPLVQPGRDLAGPHVTALALDGAGALWVGTFEHGIDRLDAATLAPSRHLPERADAGLEQVNHLLLRRRTGELVASTVRGIALLGPAGPPRWLRARDGLLGEQVAQTLEVEGGLLACTQRGVTLLPDAGPPRSLYAFHGLVANHAYAAAPAGPGLVAVGTLGGVSLVELTAGRLGPVRRSVTSARGALPASWVTALAAAEEGTYAGLYGGGVALIDRDGAARPLDLGAPGLHVDPGALLLVGDTLYVGTMERGLLAWDRRRRVGRAVAAPLPARAVTALASDGDTLYVGTERGLVTLPLGPQG